MIEIDCAQTDAESCRMMIVASQKQAHRHKE